MVDPATRQGRSSTSRRGRIQDLMEHCILAGDKVLLELSPYDLSKGRITVRQIETQAGGGAPRPAHPLGRIPVEPLSPASQVLDPRTL